MTLRLGILFAVAWGLLLAGCQAAPGERCDQFFKNTCAYPGLCVDTGDAKVCAVYCETRMSGDDMGQKYCKDPAHDKVEVTAKQGSVSGAMGCYCVPKK